MTNTRLLWVISHITKKDVNIDFNFLIMRGGPTKKVVPTGINGAVECTGRTGDHSSTSGSEPASGLTGSIKP